MANTMRICSETTARVPDTQVSTRLPGLFSVLGVLALFSSSTAHAFGSCSDSSYLSHFGLVISIAARCEEVSTEATMHTADGTRQIRIVRLVRGAHSPDEETISAVRRAVDDATRATLQLGRFSMDEATILVVDGASPTGGEHFGSHAVRAEAGIDENECYVTLGEADTGGSAREIAPLIAAALFRCIEGKTLRPAQIDTIEGENSKWWYEGSADWFATLAVDSEEFRRDRMGEFDHTSTETPLYHMGEAASIFFDWLGHTRGDLAIIPMLRQMADSDEESAQVMAMTQSVTPAEWLNFAEAYLDGKIVDGQNHEIESEPEEGHEWEWEGTSRIPLVLEPFLLIRHRMKFGCAPWAVFEIPDTPEARRVGYLDSPEAKPGIALSMAIHSVESNRLPWTSGLVHPVHGTKYWFAGMYAGLVPTNVLVVGNAGAECEEEGDEPPENPEGDSEPKACAGYRKIDQCMVGKWQLSGGGPIPWMQSMHIPNVHTDAEYQGQPPSFVLKEDGTSAGDVSTQADTFVTGMSLRGSPGVAHGHGTLDAHDTGTWSVNGGSVYFCENTLDMNSDFHGETRYSNGVVVPMQPKNFAPPSSTTRMSYTCRGDTLHMVMHFPIPRVPDMPFTYTRVASQTNDEHREQNENEH